MIRRSGKGFKVFAKGTGKPLSKRPMTKAKALRQLRAVEYSKAHAGK